MRRRRPLLAATLALVAALRAAPATAQAFMPSLAFNWTLDDLDAQLNWLPDDYPNTTEAGYKWRTELAEDPNAAYTPGMMGSGATAHTATAVNVSALPDSMGPNAPYGLNVPALHVRFQGTALYIYGSAEPPAGNWSTKPLVLGVDQQETDVARPAGDTGLLASRDDLPWGYHVVMLYLNFGRVTIDRVVVTTGMKTKAPSMDKVNVQAQYALLGDNATVNPFFRLAGRWNASQGLGGVAGEPRYPYPYISSSSNNSALSFDVPQNTSYIVVNGTAGPQNGIMYYVWNVAPPLVEWVSGFASYNAWSRPNVMYATTLDPAVKYNLTLGPLATTNTTGNVFGLHSVEFYSALSNYKPKASGGEITGVVLGAMGLAALVAGGSYWWGRRRERRRLRVAPAQVTSVSKVDLVELGDMSSPEPSAEGSSAGGAAGEPGGGSGEAAWPGPSSPSHGPFYAAAKAQTLQFLSGGAGAGAGAQRRTASPVAAAAVRADATATATAAWPALVVANPGTGGDNDEDAEEQARTAAAVALPLSRAKSQSRRSAAPARPRTVEQEEDAGAVVVVGGGGERERELVPPVYDPAWAREREGGSDGDGDGDGGGVTLPALPTAAVEPAARRPAYPGHSSTPVPAPRRPSPPPSTPARRASDPHP